jgi:small subunit ribosomal protein S11
VALTLTNTNTFVNISKVSYRGRQLNQSMRFRSVEKASSRTLTYTSGGLCGFTGSKKASVMANTTIGEVAAMKIKKLGIRHLHLILFGKGKRKKEIIRGFTKYGLSIDSIEHKTPFPHNGVRNKKPRRI